MVVAEAMMGLNALKTALEMAKALKDISDASIRAAAVLDLQKELIAAYAAQTALMDHNRILEEKIRGFETWDAEKQRYELKDLGKGFFAYIVKEGMETGESAHALCTNCYEKKFKSVLHNSGHPTIHDRTWDCPSCKTKIKNTTNDIGQLIAKSRQPSA